MTYGTGLRRSLLTATSFAAVAISVPAVAQEVEEDQFRIAPTRASVVNTQAEPIFDVKARASEFQVENYRTVVPGYLDPNAPPPAGVLDTSGVNGVGMVYRTSGFVCSGTLINNRTVISAAHCFNNVPAETFGENGTGERAAFSFGQDALPGFINWINNDYQSNADLAVYDVEHIWYDERSNEGDNIGFLEADIAIATLAAPAFDVPKWAMLFTPLSEQAHATVTGYGRSGNGSDGAVQGIDWRRRAGENFVSWLGSIDDRNTFLFGAPFGDNPTSLYWTGLTCREGDTTTRGCEYDFKIWGANDVSLPAESTTAGGDSGGPLIVDQKWDTPVIAGVLSGGSRFYGPQPFSSFGTVSFYQPLFEYWQVIVANNPYTYASARRGNGRWEDPRHWVRDLDPSYMVEIDGELLNGVPTTLGTETAGGAAGFGDVCYFSDCQVFDYDPVVVADGTYARVKNGPGTSRFVPNNVSADPAAGVAPKYYEVSLRRPGTTQLNSGVEIDVLNVDGEAELFVGSTGVLSVLGDVTQLGGKISNTVVISANDFLFGAGVVTGTGSFQADFATFGASLLAPGARNPFNNTATKFNYGTLYFTGDVIMTSGSAYVVDVTTDQNDRIGVRGVLSLSNDESDGGTLFLRRPAQAAAPRDGQSFVVARANGGVVGEFGEVVSLLGNLQATPIYGDNTVRIRLQAGSLASFVADGATVLPAGDAAIVEAFAKGLDELRDAGHYDNLWNLFGSVDVMDPYTLAGTLSGLAPTFNNEGSAMQERQSNVLMRGVTDRLSVMGNVAGGTLSITGTPRAAIGGSYESASTQTRLGVASLAPTNEAQMVLPEGVTGFVTGGVISSANSFGVSDTASDGQRSSYFGMGIEHEMADGLNVGVAFGRASGRSYVGGDFADSELNQAAAYGSYQLGGGAYVGFVGGMEMAQLETTRSGHDGAFGYQLLGASKMRKLSAMGEAGVNLDIARDLTLTPRAQLAYSNTKLNGFNEVGGETALAIDDLASERVEARFGAKLAGSQGVTGKWTLVPQVEADYVRVVDGANDGMTVRFANAADVAIALPFAAGDTSWGEVKGGIQLTNGTVQFGASFETAIGREAWRDDRAMADFTVKF